MRMFPRHQFSLLITIIFLVFSSLGFTKETSKTVKQLPDLVLSDLSGQVHNLTEWKGRVIMLNFWASWCAPCQIEIPDFIDYQAQYQDQGLQIIGVGLDEVKKLKNTVRTLGINYPILHADPESQYELLKKWGNSFGVLPYTVVIDRNGGLAYLQHGIVRKETFERMVKPLL